MSDARDVVRVELRRAPRRSPSERAPAAAGRRALRAVSVVVAAAHRVVDLVCFFDQIRAQRLVRLRASQSQRARRSRISASVSSSVGLSAIVPPGRESYSRPGLVRQCQSMTRAWVEIDLGAIVRNARAMAARVACASADGEGGCVRPRRGARRARARAARAVGLRRRDGREGSELRDARHRAADRRLHARPRRRVRRRARAPTSRPRSRSARAIARWARRRRRVASRRSTPGCRGRRALGRDRRRSRIAPRASARRRVHALPFRRRSTTARCDEQEARFERGARGAARAAADAARGELRRSASAAHVAMEHRAPGNFSIRRRRRRRAPIVQPEPVVAMRARDRRAAHGARRRDRELRRHVPRRARPRIATSPWATPTAIGARSAIARTRSCTGEGRPWRAS